MAQEHETMYNTCFARTEKAFLLQLQPLDCDYPGFSVLLSSIRLGVSESVCVCVCVCVSVCVCVCV